MTRQVYVQPRFASDLTTTATKTMPHTDS